MDMKINTLPFNDGGVKWTIIVMKLWDLFLVMPNNDCNEIVGPILVMPNNDCNEIVGPILVMPNNYCNEIVGPNLVTSLFLYEKGKFYLNHAFQAT